MGKGNRIRRRLAALALLVFLGGSAWGTETIPLILASGRIIEARLDLPHPRPAAGRRIPVVLVFGGFQKAGQVIELLRGAGLGEGYALASFDYPFDLPRKVLWPDSLFWIPRLHRMVHETFEGIILLSRRLGSDPRLDPDRVIGLGASLGAPMVLGAAARGARLTRLALVHGFGDFERSVAWQFERPWSRSWGAASFLARPASHLLSHALLWQSGFGQAEDWAAALPAGLPVLQIRASEDEFVPREAIDSLEEALRRSKATVRFARTDGGHLQPGAEATLRQVGGILQDWEAPTTRSPAGGPCPRPTGPGSCRAPAPAPSLQTMPVPRSLPVPQSSS